MLITMTSSTNKRRRSANNRHAKYSNPSPMVTIPTITEGADYDRGNGTTNIPYYEDKEMLAKEGTQVRSFKSPAWNQSRDLTSLLLTNRLTAYNSNASASHEMFTTQPTLVQPQLISTSNDALAMSNLNSSWILPGQVNPYHNNRSNNHLKQITFDEPWGNNHRRNVSNNSLLYPSNASNYDFKQDVPLLIGACIGGLVLVIIVIIVICFICERNHMNPVDTFSISSRNDSQPSISSRRSNFLKRNSSNLYINNPNSDDSGSNEVHFFGDNIHHYSLAMQNADKDKSSKNSAYIDQNLFANKFNSQLEQDNRLSGECSSKIFFHNPVNSCLLKLESAETTLDSNALDASGKSRQFGDGFKDHLLNDIGEEGDGKFGEPKTRLACYRAQSLPWPNEKRLKSSGDIEEHDDDGEDLNRYFNQLESNSNNKVNSATLGRIPFVKKQRNRMGTGIAAAIALNRSGMKLNQAKLMESSQRMRKAKSPKPMVVVVDGGGDHLHHRQQQQQQQQQPQQLQQQQQQLQLQGCKESDKPKEEAAGNSANNNDHSKNNVGSNSSDSLEYCDLDGIVVYNERTAL